MSYTTLISCADLVPNLGRPGWAVFDCRFDLRAPSRGRESYLEGHITGAIHADLDRDLTGPVVRGVTGRHPLPTIESLTETLSGWGVDRDVQVVAYDDSGGSMAARLWWMLRWLGHDAVAVLDGGWSAWQSFGGPLGVGVESRAPRRFVPRERLDLLVNASQVSNVIGDSAFSLCDSRNRDRYRGENETLDPVAGHIPGAVSVPYGDNLGSDGRFLSSDLLRRRFESEIPGVGQSTVIFYCGSGVTAAHNVLAFTHAGLAGAQLYPGSWSEWITDPRRPVTRGPNP